MTRLFLLLIAKRAENSLGGVITGVSRTTWCALWHLTKTRDALHLPSLALSRVLVRFLIVRAADMHGHVKMQKSQIASRSPASA